MTPPLPPPGYELVDDEPREGDMAYRQDLWWIVSKSKLGMLYIGCLDSWWIHARDLRWIARKK